MTANADDFVYILTKGERYEGYFIESAHRTATGARRAAKRLMDHYDWTEWSPDGRNRWVSMSGVDIIEIEKLSIFQ